MAVSPLAASDAGDQTAPLETLSADSEARSADSAAGVRGGSMALLAGELARLAAAGDNEGARVMHEAIGRLLAAPMGETAAPPERETAESGAPAVNLGDKRRRRAPR